MKELTKALMKKSVVTAPFSGVIDEIFVKEGEIANQIMPVLRMVNLDFVYILADVSEDYINKIGKGTSVKVTFPAFDVSFEGQIDRVGSFIKPNNRTFKIYVDLQNHDGVMKPNLLSVLKIKDFEKDSAIVVPSAVLQQDAMGNEFLYTIQSTGNKITAKKVQVVSGMSYENETIINSGLDGDEEIILKGGRSIKDGQQVKI